MVFHIEDVTVVNVYTLDNTVTINIKQKPQKIKGETDRNGNIHRKFNTLLLIQDSQVDKAKERSKQDNQWGWSFRFIANTALIIESVLAFQALMELSQKPIY